MSTIEIEVVITLLIFVVIGLALVPTVQDFTNSSAGNLSTYNSTGGDRQDTASSALMSLVPLFYVIGILLGVVGFAVYKLKYK